MAELLFPGLVLLQVLSSGRAYPSGAPSSACGDMVPRHTGVQPQPSPAPYSILTNTRTFVLGMPVTVTIVGPEYRGVLLQAREVSSSKAIGSWTLLPPDTKLLQCTGNSQGAVTHANINLKGNITSYIWEPPKSANYVYFMATVAQQRAVFWLNVRSATLTKGAGVQTSLAGGAESGPSHIPSLPLAVCLLVLQRLGLFPPRGG